MDDFIELQKTRNAAFKLVGARYAHGTTYFSKYSPIYMASTSNVKGTLKLYNDYETVLCLGSTGAHGYEAALNGAKKVDMFDINELQRLYYLFMQTSIMVLSYEDFIKYFTLSELKKVYTQSDIKDFLSTELFQELSNALPTEVSFAFEEIFENFPNYHLIFTALFRFEHNMDIEYLKKYMSFYNKDDYYKLQTILRENKCEFNYHQCSIRDVPTMFQDQYDLILLDNLTQYYKEIPMLNTPYAINQFITNNLSDLLTENGKIQSAYGFEVATVALRSFLKLPLFEQESRTLNFFEQLAINEDVKEGICPNLIRKWPDNYTYEFIEGVEEHSNYTSQNVILTYQKKK